MSGLYRLAVVCVIAGMVVAMEKPCCVSKKWTGKMRVITASVGKGSMAAVFTENAFMLDYDQDMRMERVQGHIKITNGSMITDSDYVVYNDFRHFQYGCYYFTIVTYWEIPHVTSDRCLITTRDLHTAMRKYTMSSFDPNCKIEMLVDDQTDPCVPSTLVWEGNYTVGSTSEGVHVNAWSGVYENFNWSMLTTVNDCTPLSLTRHGSTPDGTSISEETVYADVTQYMTSVDAFKLPDMCKQGGTPIGK